uniref:Uncharacterized protein n=1 Tax=Arundo donax TaxID=35708 RepID=A0A0A9EBN6_ARUDO
MRLQTRAFATIGTPSMCRSFTILVSFGEKFPATEINSRNGQYCSEIRYE